MNSLDFSLGNATISSSASLFRSEADINADRAILRSSKLSPCFDKLITKEIATSLPSNAKVDSASLKVTSGTGGGPANVVATGTGTIKITVKTTSATVYLRVAFIVGPKIEANVDAENIGSPVSAPLFKNAVQAVAQRVAKA